MSRYLGVLLVLGAVWGTSFLFIKVAVAELPPETVVAGRLGIAAIILTVVLYARGLRLPTDLKTWRSFLIMGLLGLVLPFVLIAWGEQSIPSGMAAILNATTPLFSTLIGYWWGREERLTGLRLVGVMLGFVGVVVAVGLRDAGAGTPNIAGYLAVLAAALCYGGAALFAHNAFRGMPPLLPATGQLIAGSVVIVPIAWLRHGLPSLPSTEVWAAVLALAVLCTAFAYILLYWLMERLGATRTSMVTYLMPVFALIYGALVLYEPVTVGTIAGLALVIGGILLANGVVRGRVRRPAEPIERIAVAD